MSRIYDFIGAVGKLGIEQLSRRNLPTTNGKIRLKGVQEKVTIIRDEWGIPHIYAKNLMDLAFAQGFCQAQDRLWQMELNRRVAKGTLAAIFGAEALPVDIASRTFGFHRIGKKDIELIQPHLKHILTAYLKGVNASVKRQLKKLPVEFTLAGFAPDYWTLEDMMAFSRLMAWQLSHAWQGPLLRSRLMEKVGVLPANELEMHYPKGNPSILPEGVIVNPLEGMVLKGANKTALKTGNGSNSWVLSGNKTTTGNALLCNDPHLGLSAPAIWYENHLHCPELHVTGVTIPGFPLVLVGHNEHISWGVTLAFTDCEDIYVEEFKSNGSYEYLFKGKWKRAEIIQEAFEIKGVEERHFEKIVLTHHGPIISKVIDYPQKHIALQSMALRPAPLLQSWWQLNKASCWKDFVHAMSFMKAPQMNIVYADTKGNIGYWLTGQVPIRAKGDGRMPVSGSSGEFEWSGIVPFMEMPHGLNPEKGYIITANNKAVTDDYPHHLGHAWMNGFRARRLEELMQTRTKLSLQDCKQMQLDWHCASGLLFAKEYKKVAKKFKNNAPLFQKALYRLIHWDGLLDAQSVGGCIYELSRFYLLKVLFQTELGEELTYSLIGRGFHPILNPTTEFQGHDIQTILRVLKDKDSWWLKKSGGKLVVLEKALERAVEYLEKTLGNRISDWQWGALHKAIFPHAMGIKKPLDKVFNVGPFPIGGDGETPWQVCNVGGSEFPNQKITSASWRQIIDMGDLSKSQAVLPPGQSGHVASPHYKDQVQLWLNGQLRPMLWTKKQVKQYAVDILVLGRKKK